MAVPIIERQSTGPDQCPAQVRETLLATSWLHSGRDFTARASALVELAWQRLRQPRQVRWLKGLGLLLAALWLLASFAQLFWALWPQPEVSPAAAPINPARETAARDPAGTAVDLEALRAAALFGRSDVADADEVPLPAQREVREGIEENARETRLDLVLRGVVASPLEGQGSAVIEVRGQQDVYHIDQALPLPGRVSLAKVLPDRVVLDNAGTYELLRLYDESELDRELGRRSRASDAQSPPRQVDQRGDGEVAELASRYREQLYRDPQSLASLVRIAPVREGGALRGYRLSPGENREQFERLGFRAGDLVVAVNGMPLSDPANAMRLYQLMRSAPEATFELQRDGQPLAVSISLGDAAPDA